MSYGVGYTCALQYSCIQETVQIAWTINTKNSEKKKLKFGLETRREEFIQVFRTLGAEILYTNKF